MKKKFAVGLLIPLTGAFIFNLLIPKAGCSCIDAKVYQDGTVVWINDDTTVTPSGELIFKDGRKVLPDFWQRLYYRNYFKKPKVSISGELSDAGEKK